MIDGEWCFRLVISLRWLVQSLSAYRLGVGRS